MRKWPAAFFTALVLLCPPVPGRVFRVIGSMDGRLNTAGLPWVKAYETTMNVNGRRSVLMLYSARYTQPAVQQLKDQFELQGAQVEIRLTPEGASGVACWPDRTAKFMVISSSSQPRHLIFLSYPESDKPGRIPSFPVPEYLGGEARSVVVDEDTSTFSATITTPDSATQVHAFYASALAGAGWTLVAPAVVRDGTVNGMAVYMKGSQVCYVQAVDKPGQPNMVTLLVKGGKL